ncbi:uncharacterized protein LOC135145136 [Zophobas morio]|uniref:uncharacterized protein LOC135145136 n=1 Tax=Zophobas morio TaxID=2755281 RepID=UPI003083A5B1
MEDKLDTFRSIPIQYGLKKIVGEYQELFNQFLSSLDSLKPESSLDVLTKIFEKDEELNIGLRTLVEHQRFQSHINYLEELIKRVDKALVDVLSVLKKVENNLEQVVEKSKKHRTFFENKREVPVNNIIKYAGLLAYSVAPPPRWNSAYELHPFSRPYPSELDKLHSQLSRLDAIQEDTALKRETQISSFERKNSNLEKVEPHEISCAVGSESETDVSFFSEED